jgi:uncharacterized protein YerC
MYGDHTPGQLPKNNDVVLLLSHQHERIHHLLDTVGDSTGTRRRRAFKELVHLVTIHETVEEQVLHPRARRLIADGEEIVGRRVEEERRIKESLSRLEKRGVDDPGFDEGFRALRDEILAHTRAEESYEFAPFRRHRSPAELQSLAKRARVAGAFAPTHPHAPKGDGKGPVKGTAVLDRARDALHTAHDGLVWLRSWYVH